MKIGVRAHDYGRREIAQMAEVLEREGYQSVQLALPKAFSSIRSYEYIAEKELYEIAEEFGKRGIEIAVLGCYMDLGNPDASVREAAVKTFGKYLGFSKNIGARLTGSETAYSHLTKLEKHRWFPFMMDSLKRLTEEAERLNTWMGIEPVAWHPLDSADTAAEVIRDLKSDHVKIIFDPVNVLERPGEVLQEAYWRRCFKELGPYIETIHLKDFTVGENGEYCPKLLGEGVMDFGVLKEWMKGHPDIPVLREEMNPETAGRDIAFMKGLYR